MRWRARLDTNMPDICIIGGGPAGLSAAIAMRLAGQSVVVLDSNRPPIDKACGEGLLPDTLDALESMGVQFPAREGFAFRGVRFVNGRDQVSADFPDRSALGLRRTILHRVLVERATELNVDLRWGQKKVRYSNGLVSVESESIHPLLTIGADGQSSSVRRAAGLDGNARYRFRYGFRRHYAVAPWSPYMELHWSRTCQLYITPISKAEIGIAVLTDDSRLRIDDALRLFPHVAVRLAGEPSSSPEAGSLTSMRALRRMSHQNLALVGDASGSVDAITGEGIGLAVRQASALARLWQTGRLAEYNRTHRQISRRPTRMAELLLLLARFDTVRDLSIRGLRRYPSIFQRALALHIGDHPFRARVLNSPAAQMPDL